MSHFVSYLEILYQKSQDINIANQINEGMGILSALSVTGDLAEDRVLTTGGLSSPSGLRHLGEDSSPKFYTSVSSED